MWRGLGGPHAGLLSSPAWRHSSVHMMRLLGSADKTTAESVFKLGIVHAATLEKSPALSIKCRRAWCTRGGLGAASCSSDASTCGHMGMGSWWICTHTSHTAARPLVRHTFLCASKLTFVGHAWVAIGQTCVLHVRLYHVGITLYIGSRGMLEAAAGRRHICLVLVFTSRPAIACPFVNHPYVPVRLVSLTGPP